MMCFCSLRAEKKGGYFHALSGEAYETLLLPVQGNFKVPLQNAHANRGMQ